MAVIEIPDSQAEALKAKAADGGLALKGRLEKLAQEGTEPKLKPKKSAYGLLASVSVICSRIGGVTTPKRNADAPS